MKDRYTWLEQRWNDDVDDTTKEFTCRGVTILDPHGSSWPMVESGPVEVQEWTTLIRFLPRGICQAMLTDIAPCTALGVCTASELFR